MEKQKSHGKKSLPGDRQGGFEADAELDSMPDVGGRKLNRRAPVPQEPTADYNPKDNSTQHHGNTIQSKAKKIIIKTKPTVISKSKHAATIHLLLIGNPSAGHFELITTESDSDNDTRINGSVQDINGAPAQRALPGFLATTKAGSKRQRMTWSDQMNRTVMRCYYKATKLETVQ
ncbi:unnamed protein product [Ceutorhynchus assimilis]|uniref:Uncharacterized protein n=1 Tax=Ceutorhynchus assimilis TaxID=467358 RepID=A0A9N9MU57_9CUCU|nr:unnamed protein product [Ceutorhynchus assimilis]